MKTKTYRIVAQYESTRRIIRIDSSLKIAIQDLVKETFSLDFPIICTLKALQAEIPYSNEVEEGDETMITTQQV